MNRELKFRAWVKKRKGYRELDQLVFDNQGIEEVWVFPKDDEIQQVYNPLDVVVEQYTGLKDKNGKEIYEGDILESTWNGDKAEVVWNDVEGEWEHYADFNTHSKYSGSVIIGNIHENPELIGGEE